MENYSYSSSAASSPRSRDLEDENPNTKIKFLCSYNGQIQPRQHDPTRLTYVGGDTKIISIDRHVTFSSFSARLASVSCTEKASLSIKYQLPGEDLDGLISVTNDEDLVNLMAEHERLPRPARLRIFLFPAAADGRWFADALTGVKEGLNNNDSNNYNNNNNSNNDNSNSDADFLFGLEGNAEAKEECHVIGENVGVPRAYTGGDYYQQGVPVTVPHQYWQERHVATGGLPEQPVYLIQTPSGVYQSAPLRPMTGQLPDQCYYGMQPIYNHAPQPLIQQGVFRGQAVEQRYAAYDMASRQQGMVQGQSAYGMAGRQVYYSTGVMPQYQAVAVAATAAQDSGNVVVVSKAL